MFQQKKQNPKAARYFNIYIKKKTTTQTVDETSTIIGTQCGRKRAEQTIIARPTRV